MHRTIKYNVSKFTDCNDGEDNKLVSFTIRTTDGKDEAYASKRAEAKGSSMSEELIRFSVVSYEIEDGPELPAGTATKTIEVKQPFEAFDNWSTKVRNFVVLAWKKLSTPSDGEAQDFFASASEIA